MQIGNEIETDIKKTKNRKSVCVEWKEIEIDREKKIGGGEIKEIESNCRNDRKGKLRLTTVTVATKKLCDNKDYWLENWYDF